MLKAYIISVLLIVVLLFPVACTSPVPETAPQEAEPPPTPTPELTPDEFKVTSLVATPIVAEPGQAVTINAEVKNIGEREGFCPLVLTVNKVEEEIKNATVAPRATETLAFNLTRDASGLYDIEVSGLTETLRVKRPGDFPRLANFYCGPNAFFVKLAIPNYYSQSELDSLLNYLARWDIITIHFTTMTYTPETIRKIKELNPRAKILAYIEAGSGGIWRWLLTNDLEASDKPEWMTPNYIEFSRYLAEYYGITAQDSNESFFLHYGDTPGNSKPPEQRRCIMWTNGTTGEQWPGMNPNSDWAIYLPHFVNDQVISSGLFDGVFYDCLWESTWLTNIDIDNDGAGDSLAVVNQKYQAGMAQLLKLTRELLGPDAIIICNPGAEWSANSLYWEHANGLYQENALGTETWSNHDFAKVWEVYQRNMQQTTPPSRICWIGADMNDAPSLDHINPDIPPADLQRMRYGLAITLLDDGYYGFDTGNDFHGALWWFPEYDANLGLAMGDAQERGDGSWTREFDNGVVVVNPTSKESPIEFAATYKDVTTGIEGTSFVVQPEDGRIFVKSE
jgi:hypothetical protein